MTLWMKFQSESIQMKATEQYFPMFILLYRVVLTSVYAVDRDSKVSSLN